MLFSGMTLTNMTFDNVNLTDADFAWTTFVGYVNFINSNLTNARFESTRFTQNLVSSFRGTTLTGANFVRSGMTLERLEREGGLNAREARNLGEIAPPPPRIQAQDDDYDEDEAYEIHNIFHSFQQRKDEFLQIIG